MELVNIEELIEKTIVSIDVSKFNDEIYFYTDNGDYKMYHIQDCCESVILEDVIGDLKDICGEPVLFAAAASCLDKPPLYDGEESYTWTFYKIQTMHGDVTLRWYGCSNGYYSEEVDFVKLTNDEP